MTQESDTPDSALIFLLPFLGSALGAIITGNALYLLITVIAHPDLLQIILRGVCAVVLLLLCLNMLAKLFRQVRRLQLETARPLLIVLCIVGFLGAFFFGLLALLASGNPVSDILTIAWSFLLTLASCTGLILYLRTIHSWLLPVNVSIHKPVPLPLPAPPQTPLALLPTHASSTYIQSGPLVQKPGGPRAALTAIVSSSIAKALPPPFLDDPLYQQPAPQRALFFSLPKPEAHPSTNQDACAIDEKTGCFALCDGVSNSANPRPWAMLLAQHWVQEPFFPATMELDQALLAAWRQQPRKRWTDWLISTWEPTMNQRRQATREAPVTPEEMEKRLTRGAASTFLGVWIDQTRRAWYALSIGDTCLFHLHKAKKNSSWEFVCQTPNLTSSEFTSSPFLIRSKEQTSIEYRDDWYVRGTYSPGDKLLLATDALAEWITLQRESGFAAWENLLTLTTQADFQHLIYSWRERNLIKQDDVTLVVIPL